MAQQNQELRIVRGNAFNIQIQVEAVRLDGQPIEYFRLADANPTLKVWHADQLTTHEFVIDENSVIISFDGNEGLGWYGFEMSGTFEGAPWRFTAVQVLQIVETSEKANIPSWTILTDQTYFVEGVITMYASGATYQADWNETDITSPSYIKNKPNLGVYATKTELQAETQAREHADGVLANSISQEEQARQGADTTLQGNIDAEETRAKAAEKVLTDNLAEEVQARQGADQTLQGNIDAEVLARSGADQTLQGNIDAEETRAKAAEKQNADDIDAIEAKIPEQASAQNQLADKAFVNSSIATSTATFRGTYNLVTDLHLTTSATHADIAAALDAVDGNADNNDYCFVQIPTDTATPTEIAAIERYKFAISSWDYEYTLNNSGFTAAQWAAINSGITSGLVEKLAALPTNSELNTLLNGKADKATTLAGYGITDAYTKTEVDTALGQKQNTINDLQTIRSGAAAGATAVQPAALDAEALARQQADAALQAALAALGLTVVNGQLCAVYNE